MTVARVAGADAFYSYAVVNDNVTGDGAFVAPEPTGQRADRVTLPVAVHTNVFTTELCLTNAGSTAIRLSFLSFTDKDVTLLPHEQRFIPDVLTYLGYAASAGSLRISSNESAAPFHASARTFSSTPVGGTFGVAYAAILPAAAALSETWIYGLKQDGPSRSNLAFGTADPHGGPSGVQAPLSLSVDLFDGDTGVLRGTRTVPLGQSFLDWKQLNAPLSDLGIRNGYVRVRAPAGNADRFFAYGVVNDGAVPGAGTGDGSYLAMTPVR